MNTSSGNNEKGAYTYDYPHPALTSDCVIFGFDGSDLQILLIERGLDPYKGMWALPGGFMKMNETIEECAKRELREETNVSDVYLEQFEVFSRPDRDPRGRVVTVAFIAMIRPSDFRVAGGDDASRAAWFSANMLPPLAFDHKEIIDKAKDRLKEILRLRPVAFRLLEEIFSVDELRRVYEAVNGTSYDRRNFTRKLIQSDIVEEVDLSKIEVLDTTTQNALAIDENFDATMCCEPDTQYLNVIPEVPVSGHKKGPGRKSTKLLRLKDKFLNRTYHSEDKSPDSIGESIKDLFNF